MDVTFLSADRWQSLQSLVAWVAPQLFRSRATNERQQDWSLGCNESIRDSESQQDFARCKFQSSDLNVRMALTRFYNAAWSSGKQHKRARNMHVSGFNARQYDAHGYGSAMELHRRIVRLCRSGYHRFEQILRTKSEIGRSNFWESVWHWLSCVS